MMNRLLYNFRFPDQTEKIIKEELKSANLTVVSNASPYKGFYISGLYNSQTQEKIQTTIKSVISSKIRLNQEFNEKSQIRGQVFYLFYPHGFHRLVGIFDPLPNLLTFLISPLLRLGIVKIQSILVNSLLKALKIQSILNFPSWMALGNCHAEVQINQKKKSFLKFYSGSIQEVHAPNLKTREYDVATPYAAIEIIVTPKELQKLESHMDDLTIGLSCADQTISYLNKGIKETLVPYPIRVSPLLSSIYLFAKKILGSKRVGNLEVRAKGQAFWRLFSPEMIGEMLIWGSLVTKVANLGIKTFKNYLKTIQEQRRQEEVEESISALEKMDPSFGSLRLLLN